MSPRSAARDLSGADIWPVKDPSTRSGSGGGPLHGGLRLLAAADFVVDDPELAYLLTITIRAWRRRVVCGGLTVTPRDDSVEPVTGKALRSLPVDGFVKEIVRGLLASGSPPIVHEEQIGDSVAIEPPSAVAAADLLDDDRRRRVAKGDVLPEVVRLYRQALADPDEQHAPTAFVARTLVYSRGHASKLVSDARQAGLLGPMAGPGVPGEAEVVSSPKGKKASPKRKGK